MVSDRPRELSLSVTDLILINLQGLSAVLRSLTKLTLPRSIMASPWLLLEHLHGHAIVVAPFNPFPFSSSSHSCQTLQGPLHG